MQLFTRAIHIARNINELFIKREITCLEGLYVHKLIQVDILKDSARCRCRVIPISGLIRVRRFYHCFF